MGRSQRHLREFRGYDAAYDTYQPGDLEERVLGLARWGNGSVYNFADTLSMYVDRYGRSSIGAPEATDLIGLVIDKAAGRNQLQYLDGRFTSLTGWTAASSSGTPPGVSLNNGRIRITASADGVGQRVDYVGITGLTTNAFYRMRAYVADQSSAFTARIAISGVPALDERVGPGWIESTFATLATSPTLRLTLPINPGENEWVEFDNVSFTELPGRHLIAGSDSTRGVFGSSGLTLNGLDDYYLTNHPNTLKYVAAKLTFEAASSSWAPLMCNQTNNQMNLRRSAATAAYGDGVSGSVADFAYADGFVEVNGTNTSTFTYDVSHVVEAGLGSSATLGAVTNFFGNVTLGRYFKGSVRAMVLLHETPSDKDRALVRKWLGSL